MCAQMQIFRLFYMRRRLTHRCMLSTHAMMCKRCVLHHFMTVKFFLHLSFLLFTPVFINAMRILASPILDFRLFKRRKVWLLVSSGSL